MEDSKKNIKIQKTIKKHKNWRFKKNIVCYCWTVPIYDLRRSVTKKILKINYIILENDRKELKKKYKNSKNNKYKKP